MTQRQQSIGILSFTLMLIALIYAWFYPLNTGQMSVTTGLNDYQLFVDGQSTACPQDPCVLKISPGSHDVVVHKDRYLPARATAVIRRWSATPVNLVPARIYTLNTSAVVPRLPEEKPLPELPDALKVPAVLGATWSPDGSRAIYLDTADDHVKVWSAAESRPLTTLRHIEGALTFRWSPDGSMALGENGTDLYWIGLKEGSRKKQILPFEPIAVVWSPQNDFVLLNDARGQLYRADAVSQELKVMSVPVDLKNAAWLDKISLLSFYVEKGATSIFRYTPAADISDPLMTQPGLKLDQINYAGGPVAYFHDSSVGGWLELEL